MNALGVLLHEALAQDGAILDGQSAPVAYAELRCTADLVAGALTAERLGMDEPVHVVIGNRPADFAALLGVWMAGGVAVPVHIGAQDATIARLAALTQARLLVDGAVVRHITGAAPPPRDLLRGAALIVSTSGSTGLPKGVVLGHERFVAKLDVLDALLRLRPGDRVVAPLQLTFVFGLWVALLTLRSGGTLALLSRFSLAALAEQLDTGTVLAAVPSTLRLLQAELALRAPGPRLLLTGGEALGAPLRSALVAQWPGADIHDLYGSTETGACDFCQPGSAPVQEAGAIGRPTPGVTYRIEAGELQVRSPFGMLGYLDDPGLTETAFQDGFFRTGDIAVQHAGGQVELVGRSKEIVSRGGNKIAPQEVDNLLGSHAEIAAALSVGAPHKSLGEALHSVVVPRAGCTPDPAALRAWLAERLERYKLPDTIEVVDALPTGSTGKASRALLRERLMARSASA